MTFRVTFATVTQHSLYFLLRFSSTGTKERHWTGNHPDKDNFRQKRVVWKVCILSFQFAQFIQQVRFKVLLNRRWIYVKEIRLRRNSILRIIYLKGKTLQGDGDSKKKRRNILIQKHIFLIRKNKNGQNFSALQNVDLKFYLRSVIARQVFVTLPQYVKIFLAHLFKISIFPRKQTKNHFESNWDFIW